MEANALITLRGEQSIDGELDTYELTTEGTYVKKGDKYYVSYEGSEITGYDKTTTTLKIKNDFVSMIRFGDSPTQMVFEEGNLYTGVYHTPFGSLSVGVTTNSMRVDVGEEGGEVELDYYVRMNDGEPVKNALHMKIRKMGPKTESFPAPEGRYE